MIEQVQALLKDNPIIAGGAGMAVMGWIMVQARNVPLKLWRYIQDQFSLTLTVYSEDAAFNPLNVWLAKHPSTKHTRRLGTAVYQDARNDKDEFVLTPGPGLHLLREGMRFYLVSRQIDQEPGFNQSFYASRRQTLTITTLGRSHEPMKNLLAQALVIREDHDTIPVHIWTGHGYSLVERRLKRPLDTIYIDPAQKAEIVADLRRFLSRRAWYAERAIPWRRGYMFEGEPGTGKSSLIFALASEFEKPVYIINPSAISNDNELLRAMNEAGTGMVVLEDIDSLNATEDREVKVKAREQALAGTLTVAAPLGGPTTSAEASKAGVTTSGLLNALDGIGARDGRITFLTSNHADILDAAMLRPGRCDRRFVIRHAEEPQVRAMHERWFPGESAEAFVKEVKPLLPVSAAELQNRLLCKAEAA